MEFKAWTEKVDPNQIKKSAKELFGTSSLKKLEDITKKAFENPDYLAKAIPAPVRVRTATKILEAWLNHVAKEVNYDVEKLKEKLLKEYNLKIDPNNIEIVKEKVKVRIVYKTKKAAEEASKNVFVKLIEDFKKASTLKKVLISLGITGVIGGLILLAIVLYKRITGKEIKVRPLDINFWKKAISDLKKNKVAWAIVGGIMLLAAAAAVYYVRKKKKGEKGEEQEAATEKETTVEKETSTGKKAEETKKEKSVEKSAEKLLNNQKVVEKVRHELMELLKEKQVDPKSLERRAYQDIQRYIEDAIKNVKVEYPDLDAATPEEKEEMKKKIEKELRNIISTKFKDLLQSRRYAPALKQIEGRKIPQIVILKLRSKISKEYNIPLKGKYAPIIDQIITKAIMSLVHAKKYKKQLENTTTKTLSNIDRLDIILRNIYLDALERATKEALRKGVKLEAREILYSIIETVEQLRESLYFEVVVENFEMEL